MVPSVMLQFKMHVCVLFIFVDICKVCMAFSL